MHPFPRRAFHEDALNSRAHHSIGIVFTAMALLACTVDTPGSSMNPGDGDGGDAVGGGASGPGGATTTSGESGAGGGAPTEQEPCNGIDDNQDGTIDEGCPCEPGHTQPCFGGPAESADVGLCKTGEQQCEGGNWGSCEGQVLPLAEKCDELDHDCDGHPRNGEPEKGPCDAGQLGVCAEGELSCTEQGLICEPVKAAASVEQCNGKDDDCDGLVDEGCANKLTTWGVDWQDYVSALAARGSMLVVATADSTSNKGGYVMRLDPNSLATQWPKFLASGAGKVVIRDLAVDSQQNVLVVGSVTGGTSEQSPLGGTDVFVAKLDGKGKLLWQQLMGGSGDEQASSVIVFADDSIVVGGAFDSNSVIIAGVPLSNAGGWDGFVARLASDGSPIWAQSFGSQGSDWLQALTVTAGGDLLLAGEVAGAVDLGGGPLPAVGGAVVAKLSPSGQHLWSKHLTGNIEVEAIAVRPKGDWVLGGSVSGTYDFGAGPVNPGSGSLALVIACDDGAAVPNWVWTTKKGYADVNALAVGAAGDVMIAGGAWKEVDFGVGPIPALGARDVVVGRLDPNGAPVWIRRFGNSFSKLYASESATGIAVMPDSTLVVGGHFWESMDLGGPGLKASHPGFKLQGFVARFKP